MKQRIGPASKTPYLRNFVFGVEDSLVSTVGLLSGVAIAGIPRATIILTGVVLIFVEAISMAAGSFLSEKSAEEYENHADVAITPALIASGIMFFSYFLAGLIPLTPYTFLETTSAFWISIGCSVISLFILGIISARLTHVSFLRSALRMMLIGGLAIGVGVLVGKFTHIQ